MREGEVEQMALLDGSRLIVEACVQAGAEVYVGYPITPANYIYAYSSKRFPAVLPAPDEITTVQWMAGLTAAGRLPVTATSFPGFALMVESINMAYMMELPMLIILVQRLGPSTGSATVGAQGDLFLLRGLISGGYPLPVFCIADTEDCWNLPPIALQTAVNLRSPVVLLTSKEMIMTQRSFDLGRLGEIEPIHRQLYQGQDEYYPYATQDALVPAFLPVGDSEHQVRLTASTHNEKGILLSTAKEALANTRRLEKKMSVGIPDLYSLDEQDEATTLVVAYGITTGAAKQAVAALRTQDVPVSLLITRTLFPIPDVYHAVLDHYPRVVFAEENLQGQLAHLLFGQRLPERVQVVGDIGQMIQPEQIIQKVQEQ